MMPTTRAWFATLALCAAMSAACGRDDCGRWEAHELDPRLRISAYPIAAGLEGTLGELADLYLDGFIERDSGTTQDLLAAFVSYYSGGCPFVVAGRRGTIRSSKGFRQPWETPAVEAVDVDLRGVTYSCWGDDFGVAVGDAGVIMVGTSRATQWALAPTPTTRRLNAVATGPEGLATAVGAAGTVVRTVDAGATWELVQVPANEDLHAIHYEGIYSQSGYSPRGYIAGASGTLLFSPDGLTWERVDTGLTEDLRQVILHKDEYLEDPKPYILGDTRLFTWSPGQVGLTLVHELRRPLLSISEYGELHALAEDGVLLQYREPYVCELPRD